VVGSKGWNWEGGSDHWFSVEFPRILRATRSPEEIGRSVFLLRGAQE